MSVNEDEDDIPENFYIRPGTVDYGKDYEVQIAALLSLRCLGYKNMRSMWFAINADECGAFDDVVMCLTLKDGKSITYLIQLKHKNEPTDIGAREFKYKKGDYFITKYYNTIIQIKDAIDGKVDVKSGIIDHLRRNQDTTIFILYTNRGTTNNDSLKSVSKKSETDTKWFLYQLIDTNNGNIFLFDYEKLEFKYRDDVKGFMERFFFFTKQAHISKLEAAIGMNIENIVKPFKLSTNELKEVVLKYTIFITQWTKGELGGFYPLTKKHIYMVLLENILAPYIRRLQQPQDNLEYQYNIWSKIMQDQAVTVVELDDIVAEYLNGYIYKEIIAYCDKSENKNLWKRHPDSVSKKILKATTRLKEITPSAAYEFMWKENTLPLVIEISDSQDLSGILHILNVFKKICSVVVLLKNVTECKSKLKPFRNINDLKQEFRMEILQCPVQLQGRKSVTLSNYVTSELIDSISVKEVVYILSDKFNIGGRFCDLPEIFIERSLEKVFVQPKLLKEVSDDIFVSKCNSFYDLKQFLMRHDLDLGPEEIFYCTLDKIDNLVKHRIIIVEDNSGMEVIDQFCLNKTAHYLILHNSDNIEWSKSIGTIRNIVGYRKSPECIHIANNTTDNILSELYDSFSSSIKLISAYPGMGKSVLMDYIAWHAPIDFWVLRINLHEHEDYYKSKEFKNFHSDPAKHLEYFANKALLNKELTNNLSRVVFEKYLDSKKVLILFDEFDEISVDLQKKAAKMIKSIRDANYRMYLTTRPIMKIYLEELLDTFAVSINPFTNVDQVTFLEKYFMKTLNVHVEGNKQLVKSYVDKLLAAAVQNLNEQDERFTGVPLQTKLLADVFTDGCKSFIDTSCFENKCFDLVFLYKNFIEQKARIVCNKFGNGSNNMLHQYKEYRSLYALQLLFTEDDLKMLNIEQKLKAMLQCFPDTLQHLQKDGIVVAENESNVVFVHRTFAEYLAAVWLYKNIGRGHGEIVLTLGKKLFQPNFVTVRTIFDRLLAKKCPLHLAVINRQVNSFGEIVKSNPHSVLATDKGNRSILHIIAAWGVQHPYNFVSDWELKILYQKVAKDYMIQMLKLLPSTRLSTTKDSLFGYTQLDYAIVSGSLNIADAICAKLESTKHCISVNDIDYVSSYLLKFAYGSLGSVLIKHSIVRELDNFVENMKTNVEPNNVLHNAIMAGNIVNVSMLISKGENINATDSYGCTALHVAALFGQNVLVQLLLKNGADITKTDKSGKSALHWATVRGAKTVVSLLLSNGVNTTMRDYNGMSALHYVVVVDIENQTEILPLLLENNSDVTLKDNYGKTPLHYALHYNQIEILKLFLNFVADIKTDEPSNDLHNEDVAVGKSEYLSKVLASKDADGGSVLHWAADKGLSDIVTLFLLNGAHVEAQDNDEKTALHWSAEKGHCDTVTVLLNYGAKINAKDKNNRTSLYTAAEYGHIDIVTLLLEKGANIDEKDILGRSALYHAISNNHEDVVSLLLSHGIQTDTKDHEKMTVVHWAAFNGHDNLLHLLLTNVEACTSQDGYGRTALICASQNGYTNIVTFLVNKGADLTVTDNEGMNALHYSSWKGHEGVTKYLLSIGLNLDLPDKIGRTALVCAAHNGHTAVVKILLSHGADKEASDDEDMAALNWAANNGHADTVSTLLLSGANLELPNRIGRTALISASNKGFAAIVTALLCNGANIEAQDREGMTALQCAAFGGHTDTVNILLDKGANLETRSKYDKTALLYAANNGHTDIIGLLLTKGAEVDIRDNENMTPLTWAAHDGHLDSVVVLAISGASLEVKNKHGRTPLLCAAQNGHLEVVKLLMLEKADVEAADNENSTALHLAAFNGFYEMADVLLVKINYLEKRNIDGRTPLMHAAHNGHVDIVDLLLSKGAFIDAQDNEKMSVLHWASWNGHTDTIKLLLTKGANFEIREHSGRTPLIYAILSDELTSVAQILSKGAEIDAIDIEHKSALHFAAWKGWQNAVYVLLGVGADINLKDKYGRTALMYASCRGFNATVALLLTRNADIKVRDKEGLSALDWARKNEHSSTVLFLEKQP